MEAKAKKQFLIMEEPVKKGIIDDMDGIKDIIKHLMDNELRANLEEHRVVVTEPPNNDKTKREELVQIMFEEFKVPKLYLGNQAVMSLFATGRTTGTVLDSGEGKTHTVPIYEGYAIPHACTEIPICGRDLTKFMHQLLNQRYPDLFPDSDEAREEALEICMKIKETKGHVAQDFDAEMKSVQDLNANSD